MSFEVALQERWRTSPALLALVPNDHVYLGWVPPKDALFASIGLPMVSIKRGESETYHPSGGIKLTNGEVAFRCWGETVKEANNVAEEVDNAYGGNGNKLTWIGGESKYMRQVSMEQDKMDDGTWLVMVVYQSKTEEVV